MRQTDRQTTEQTEEHRELNINHNMKQSTVTIQSVDKPNDITRNAINSHIYCYV